MQEWLKQTLGHGYVAGPWIRFCLRETGAQVHWCQPDGLIIDPAQRLITIIEIKYQHCADAWFQMNRLYMPVLQFMFRPPEWRFATCEVVKWYDCSVAVPEPPRLRDSPLRAQPGEFAVFICKEQLRRER